MNKLHLATSTSQEFSPLVIEGNTFLPSKTKVPWSVESISLSPEKYGKMNYSLRIMCFSSTRYVFVFIPFPNEKF